MALTPFTSTIAAATANANFDDKLTALATANADGRKDWTVSLYMTTLTATTELRDRSIAWTAPDDAQLRVFFTRATDTAPGSFLIYLEVDSGDEDYLNGEAPFGLIVTTIGTADTRSGTLPDWTDTWLQVRKGVRYRMRAVSSVTIGGPIHVVAQFRTRRRDA
jgi:hypothetical protein